MADYNPNYRAIGEQFIGIYYATFDTLQFKALDTEKKKIADFYSQYSLLTFEDDQKQGPENIVLKFCALPFQKIQRKITKVDCQPTPNRGVLVHVLGQLLTDDDQPHAFSHLFLLNPEGEGYCIVNEIFRLSIHDG